MAVGYEPKVTRDLIISTPCRVCEVIQDVPVNTEDYAAWKEGVLIQEALPYIKPEFREVLITGICPICWSKMFAEDE